MFCVFITKKGFEAQNREGALSSLMISIGFFIFGIVNFVYGLFPYPYSGFMLFWMGFCFVLLYGYVLIKALLKKRKGINDPHMMFYADSTEDRARYLETLTPKQELKRKAFHLTVLLLILSYYGWGGIPATTWTNNLVIRFIDSLGDVYRALWGDQSIYPFAENDPNVPFELTFFALFALFVDLIIPDFIRVVHGFDYSIYNVLVRTVTQKKEYKALAPHTFILGAVTFIFMLVKMGIGTIKYAFVAALVGCFSDAIAAVYGKYFGKIKITTPMGSTKTLEGFIAGFILTTVITLFYFNIWISLYVAVLFLVVDYLSIPVSDNILNPIIIFIGLSILPI
jgi:dolichol kinase